MGLSNLDNLVKTEKLKIESFQEKEFMGLLSALPQIRGPSKDETDSKKSI